MLWCASLAIGMLTATAGGLGQEQSSMNGGTGSAESPVFEQDAVNPMLPPLDDPPNLETPQASLENFLLSAADDDFERAARSMNFRLEPDVTEEGATTAAERLDFVIGQTLWIDWGMVPDRPDGVQHGSAMTGQNPLAGQARRSITIGEIALRGRTVPVRLERVKAPDEPRMWLLAAQTVENVDALYEAHGPGWIERRLPGWARQSGWAGVLWWEWIVFAAAATIGPVAAFALTFVLRRLLERSPKARRLPLDRLQLAATALLSTGLLWWLVRFGLSLPGPVAGFAEPVALVLVIIAAAWLVMRTLSAAVELAGRSTTSRLHEPGSRAYRRAITKVKVARHVVMLVVALTALGLILLQFGVFRTLGIALISSAGAAAVVLGIAGHAVIGNLIAGLQIAMTQPFTLGDTVYVEGNWGRIEDITYTYVVVNTWDKRRIVLPIKYFIDNHFENWSHTDSFLVKPIYLHVDYRADVDAIRRKFLELVEADESWDREHDDPDVLVTDVQDETLVVRLTCGGATPSDAWYLHCRVREQLVAWLQGVDNGRFLPRRRIELEADQSDNGKKSTEHPSMAKTSASDNSRAKASERNGDDDGD